MDSFDLNDLSSPGMSVDPSPQGGAIDQNAASDNSSADPSQNQSFMSQMVPHAQAQAPAQPKYLSQDEFNQKVQQYGALGVPKDQVARMALAKGYVIQGVKSLSTQDYAAKVQQYAAQGVNEDQVRQIAQQKGYSLPPALPPPPPTFSQNHPILSGMASGLNDMIRAPGDLVSGLAQKAASFIPGQEARAQGGDMGAGGNVSKNAGVTAKDLAIAGTTALTGGMSTLGEMGMGAAGWGGGEALNQGIQAVGGSNQNTPLQAAESIGGNALLGAAGPLLEPLTAPLTKPLGEAMGSAIDSTGLRPAVESLKKGILPLDRNAVSPLEKLAMDKVDPSAAPKEGRTLIFDKKGNPIDANPTAKESAAAKDTLSKIPELQKKGFSPNSSPETLDKSARIIENARKTTFGPAVEKSAGDINFAFGHKEYSGVLKEATSAKPEVVTRPAVWKQTATDFTNKFNTYLNKPELNYTPSQAAWRAESDMMQQVPDAQLQKSDMEASQRATAIKTYARSTIDYLKSNAERMATQLESTGDTAGATRLRSFQESLKDYGNIRTVQGNIENKLPGKLSEASPTTGDAIKKGGISLAKKAAMAGIGLTGGGALFKTGMNLAHE